LYYRLSVFPIELPPLRDRGDDITVLAQQFLEQSSRKLGRTPPRLTSAQMKELQAYDWPGNVRELQNVIERAVIRSRNGQLEFGLRPNVGVSGRASRKSESSPVATPASLDDLKEHGRTLILDALTKTRGKIYGSDGAAALLGMKPTTLSSRVHRMGLKKFVGEPG
jgi:transcriptional regulator with GAF, ATPase, and Fis domain